MKMWHLLHLKTVVESDVEATEVGRQHTLLRLFAAEDSTQRSQRLRTSRLVPLQQDDVRIERSCVCGEESGSEVDGGH